MKKIIFVCLAFIISNIILAVPPIPESNSGFNEIKEYPSEIFGPIHNRNTELPQSILVLLVEFDDIKFDLVADYPDSLAHDHQYFDRLMFHLSSYYSDASHGQYNLTDDNYHIWENVITVSNDMGYYGDNDLSLERMCEFVMETVDSVDVQIDFNDYDSIIIFHSGAGSEADSGGNNPELLSSTFLTRRTLQAGIDPDNNNFQGIATNDELANSDTLFLKEFIVCPETEWQPGSIPYDSSIYGVFGVLVHQFGHQIGLPTLFDNDRSNGVSYGIGGFGLMGTGVWNANGFVPPLPCAWSRYYLGWEDDNIIELNATQSNLELIFPTAENTDVPKLYKINISETEYFLLENRQQNPDESYFVAANGDTLSTYTFKTELNQPVYPEVHPPGHPQAGEPHKYAGQPRFDFMLNTYKGCEWDFYLPGYSYGDAPENDGSGILIWHIDENIIDANFDPYFESNSINADSNNKGIDLEEADGMQQLDSALYGYQSFFGSRDDSFREGNNSYFGKLIDENGNYNSPTAESNYGGVPLEIYDISSSDSIMTFSVKYEWSLNANFVGINSLPAALIDFDNDGENEILYPMPNGKIYIWKDDQLLWGFPKTVDSLAALYAYNETDRTIIIPHKNPVNSIAKLELINSEETDRKFFFEYVWAASPVVNILSDEYKVFLPFNNIDSEGSRITLLGDNYEIAAEVDFQANIISNLMFKDDLLYHIDSNWNLQKLDISDLSITSTNLLSGRSLPEIDSALLVDIDQDENEEILITTKNSMLYCFLQNGSTVDGFPLEIPLNIISIPSICDLDNNGFPDILIGGENSFVVINKNAEIIEPSSVLPEPDSLNIASGVIAVDINDDGNLEVCGNMSRNRFAIWQVNENDFELDTNSLVAFGERSLNYPFFSEYSSEDISAFIPSNNGIIYKVGLEGYYPNLEELNWYTEYANLQRTASYLDILPSNPDPGNKIFKKDKTYFYPNPLGKIFRKGISYGLVVPDETIILRIETYQNCKVDIKIFDVALNMIYKNKIDCEEDFPEAIQINASKLSSGVYFGILSANGKSMNLKFAIEK